MIDMQQSGVLETVKLLELAVEDAFPIFPGKYVILKTEEIMQLIDRIYASIPVEIKEAKDFLDRIEQVKMAAQQEAEKMIADAQMEADRKLSEADFIKAVESRHGRRIVRLPSCQRGPHGLVGESYVHHFAR